MTPTGRRGATGRHPGADACGPDPAEPRHRYIAARSPQAKGRIERLWNTLQDRWSANCACAAFAPSRPRRPTWPSSSPTSISASGNRPPTARRCGAGRRAISALRPRLRLPPRGRPRQHRAPRASRGAPPWRALLRQADGRRARTARWPGRRPARRRSFRGEAPSPGPRSSSNHAARRAATAARVASVALGRSRSALPRLAPNTHTGRRPLRHPSLAARAGGRDSAA